MFSCIGHFLCKISNTFQSKELIRKFYLIIIIAKLRETKIYTINYENWDKYSWRRVIYLLKFPCAVGVGHLSSLNNFGGEKKNW